MINKWKVFALTIVTWFGMQLLAKLFTFASPKLDLISTSSTVWSWSSLIMGIYMGRLTKVRTEYIYGALMWFICLFPFISILAGTGYFGRCYYKQEAFKQVHTSTDISDNKIQ